jgi:hypothetical protein
LRAQGTGLLGGLLDAWVGDELGPDDAGTSGLQFVAQGF